MKAVLFGKIPTHGDFVSRGLTAADRDALDIWLAASLQDARDALAEGFEERYDAAPAWRFIERNGDSLTAGALAPSVDAAGRRYPIYLAIDGVDAMRALAAADACENLLYEAFEQEWDADRLHVAAEAVEVAEIEGEAIAGWWTFGADGFAAAEIAEDRPEHLFRAALTAMKGEA